MYIPKHFEILDMAEIVRFVADARAADLVTMGRDGQLSATLMPCLWQGQDEGSESHGKLVMHMARANDQWKTMSSGSVGLAIIHGPQGYVSPTNYEKKLTDHKVVPTWNYQSVHMSGTVEIIEDPNLIREIVSDLTKVHERNRENPWSTDEADPSYFEAQLRGIVGVILHITKVEAKYKLSQNRSLTDQERVKADLLNSPLDEERVIARLMPYEN